MGFEIEVGGDQDFGSGEERLVVEQDRSQDGPLRLGAEVKKLSRVMLPGISQAHFPKRLFHVFGGARILVLFTHRHRGAP